MRQIQRAPGVSLYNVCFYSPFNHVCFLQTSFCLPTLLEVWNLEWGSVLQTSFRRVQVWGWWHLINIEVLASSRLLTKKYQIYFYPEELFKRTSQSWCSAQARSDSRSTSGAATMCQKLLKEQELCLRHVLPFPASVLQVRLSGYRLGRNFSFSSYLKLLIHIFNGKLKMPCTEWIFSVRSGN